MATCTLSGADAVLGVNCTSSGTATNPSSCVTTGCPNGETACCRRQRPVWEWNLTDPIAFTGQSYVVYYDPQGTYISTGKSCSNNGLILYYAYLTRGLSGCPRNDLSVNVVFVDRNVVTAGASITMPSPAVSLTVNNAGVTCSAWTGTVRLVSDLPTWSISYNVQCSEAGKTGLRVVGIVSGND
jgi:hypothetical protein